MIRKIMNSNSNSNSNSNLNINSNSISNENADPTPNPDQSSVRDEINELAPEQKTVMEASKTAESAEAEPATEMDAFKLYPSRYDKFMSFYRALVIIAAVGIAAALAVAIYKDLMWGAVIGLGSVFVYVFFTSNEIFEKLGLAYKTSVGSLEITYCRKKYGNTFFVPSKILWYDVERIGDEAFNSEKNDGLTEIYLPRSIKSFGKDVFCGCKDLKYIRFEGSEEEWQAIEKETEPDLSEISVSYNAEVPALPEKKKTKARNDKKS